jgi:hypothetical protein
MRLSINVLFVGKTVHEGIIEGKEIDLRPNDSQNLRNDVNLSSNPRKKRISTALNI